MEVNKSIVNVCGSGKYGKVQPGKMKWRDKMKKCAKIVLALAAVCSISGIAQAAVTFMVGPSINTFNDSRFTGMGNSFTMMFPVDKLNVGYRMEQQNCTVSDALASASNFVLSSQITEFVVEKEVARLADDAPVSVGLEFGSVLTTCLAGSVAGPAGMNQVNPMLGINGGVKYVSGKAITTSLFLNIGYRFVDIRDIAVPVGFVAGGANFKDLNAMHIDLGVGIGF